MFYTLLFFLLPVLLADMLPIFLPGDVNLLIVLNLTAFFIPPYGWLVGPIATPTVLGYNLPRAIIAWSFFPAFTHGFSVLPPPPTTPIIALHLGSIDFWNPRENS